MDEISRLHTLIRQQGEELQRRDLLIRELDKERADWEREAKKYCAKLGEIRILMDGKSDPESRLPIAIDKAFKMMGS